MAIRFILIFFGMIAALVGTKAQTILLERDINESVYVKHKGPNKKNFTHLYYDYSLYFPKGEPANIYSEKSFRSFIGLRNYHRFTNIYMMGVSLEYGIENFRVKQNDQKTFPSIGVHSKETLSTSNLGIEYFNRLLITQKESSLGVWVDGGIYTNLNLSSKHVIKDKAASSDGARFHKEIDKGLKYLNKWEYGFKAKVGFKRYAIIGTYRMSDWISGSIIGFEPPRLAIGIELGFY